MVTAEAAYTQDLGLPSFGVRHLGDEGHLAVVIYKADASQALVRGSPCEVHRVEVAHVDAALGERLVEPDHQGLVLWPDRTHGYRRAVLCLGLAYVLVGVGPDGGAGQLLFFCFRVVQDNAGVERDQALRGGEQRVYVELSHKGLLDDEPAETHEQLLQGSQIHRRPAPDTLEGLHDAGAFDQPARQGRGERRQGQGGVAVDLNELAARPEEQHGPELRVYATADDKLVPLRANHRLHRDAVELPGPGLLGDRSLYGRVSFADGLHILQVEPDAADVGLVGDRLGVELEDDGVAQRLRVPDGLLGVAGDAGLDGRDAVGGNDLLGPLPVYAVLLDELGGLVGGAQIVGIAPHVIEDAGSVVRVAEGGYPNLAEDLLALLDGGTAHPARQHRLTTRFGMVFEAPCGAGRVGHVLGGEHDEQAVATWILGRDLHGSCVPLGAGVAEDVYGIVVAPVGR